MRYSARSVLVARLVAALLFGLLVGEVSAYALGHDPPAAADGAIRLPTRHVAKAKAKPTKTRPQFTLVAGGDIALGGDPQASMFAGVRRFLTAGDLTVANLEGTLATGGGPRCTTNAKSGCFVFRASPAWAGTLRSAGFTALNVANNHALDFGPAAQSETLAALHDARLAHDGLPGEITQVRAAGVKVALIGAAPYAWAQDLRDPAGTQALVRTAARRADVVVVYMHAGAEGEAADHVTGADESYLGESRGNAQAFAHAMVDAGADLVFASGPHVLRGMEWYRGHLIAYSLGNLATSHTLSTSGLLADSALLRVTLDDRGRFVRGAIVPLRLDAYGTPSFDAARASVRLIARLSREDFAAKAARLSAGGAIARSKR